MLDSSAVRRHLAAASGNVIWLPTNERRSHLGQDRHEAVRLSMRSWKLHLISLPFYVSVRVYMEVLEAAIEERLALEEELKPESEELMSICIVVSFRIYVRATSKKCA